jgi:hypothetical protein
MNIPIRHYAGAPYIRIDTVPHEDRARFSTWVYRQTCPVVPSKLDANGTPAACAYAWDYAKWIATGKPTNLADPYDTSPIQPSFGLRNLVREP